MRKRIIKILLLTLCLPFSTVAFAGIVVLKSGQTVEGNIVEKTDKYIKVDFQGVVLMYFLDEIKLIEGESKIKPASTEDISDEQKTSAKENYISTATPNENLDLISQINKAYYNLQQQGLLDFRCEVTSSIFNLAKDMLSTQHSLTDQEKEVLNSMKFYFIIDQKGKFGFDSTPYTSTGNAQFDKAVQQAIISTKSTLLGFYETWKNYVIEPKFKESDVIYAKEKLSNGYNISYKGIDLKIDKKMSIDSKFCISQETFAHNGNIFSKIMPYFVSSNQGLLLQGYAIDMDNGFVKLVGAIEYQEAEGLQMPKQAVIQSTHSGVTQNVELRFLNFTINKK